MRNKNNNPAWLSQQMNPNVVDNYYMYNVFYNILYELCLNRFTWKNLPNKIDGDFIERNLIEEGKVGIINHEDLGLVAVHCIEEGVNLYNRGVKYFCYSDSNLKPINKYYESDEIVIIRNNKMEFPTVDFIKRYSANLSHIKKIKEMNLDTQKMPFIAKGSEGQILSLINKYEKMKNFEPLIVENEQMNDDSLSVFQTGVKLIASELQNCFKDELEEYCNFIGVKMQSNKRERLVTEEVKQGDDFVDLCLSIFLNSRLQGCKEWNQKFNCNVELVLSEDNKKEVKKEGENKNDDNNNKTNS